MTIVIRRVSHYFFGKQQWLHFLKYLFRDRGGGSVRAKALPFYAWVNFLRDPK